MKQEIAESLSGPDFRGRCDRAFIEWREGSPFCGMKMPANTQVQAFELAGHCYRVCICRVGRCAGRFRMCGRLSSKCLNKAWLVQSADMATMQLIPEPCQQAPLGGILSLAAPDD